MNKLLRASCDLLRVYFDPAEIGPDGYPFAWHGESGKPIYTPAIKDLIRQRDDHRCLRCGHPYHKGLHGNGEWSPCDDKCTHGGPVSWGIAETKEITTTISSFDDEERRLGEIVTLAVGVGGPRQYTISWIKAQWRILTVHHLGEKYDCRWFMLVSLCQRCHLQVQAKVQMNRVWPWEHSDWFKPFAAAWYSWVYEGCEISYEEAVERMDELLAYERMA